MLKDRNTTRFSELTNVWAGAAGLTLHFGVVSSSRPSFSIPFGGFPSSQLCSAFFSFLEHPLISAAHFIPFFMMKGWGGGRCPEEEETKEGEGEREKV